MLRGYTSCFVVVVAVVVPRSNNIDTDIYKNFDITD
jgi:hypothetical protein